MNDRTYVAYEKWALVNGLCENEESLNSFYEDFIGIFRTHTDFYAHIYNVPRTFLDDNDFPLLDFPDLYYTNTITISVDIHEPWDSINTFTGEFRGMYMAFYKHSNKSRSVLKG